MAETVTVHGLKELGDRLRALPAEIASKGGGPLRAALAKVARVVREEAKARAPVRKGFLRDNIIIVRDRDPRRSGMTERFIMTVRSRKKVTKRYSNTRRNRRLGRVGQEYKGNQALFYARFLEFGTANMPARPFMRPAFEAKKGELPTLMQREMALAMQRAVRKLGRR